MRHANQPRNLSAEYILVNQTDSSDEARHIMFYKFAKPGALLPASDTLRFHLMRVHTHCAPPELPSVDTMGWKCCEWRLEPILMSLSPSLLHVWKSSHVREKCGALVPATNAAEMDCNDSTAVCGCIHGNKQLIFDQSPRMDRPT